MPLPLRQRLLVLAVTLVPLSPWPGVAQAEDTLSRQTVLEEIGSVDEAVGFLASAPAVFGLALVRTFADATFDDMSYDPRLGELTVTGLHIEGAFGAVDAAAVSFSSGRVAVRDLALDRKKLRLPKDMDNMLAAFGYAATTVDGIIDYRYDFSRSALDAAIHLSASDAGALDFSVKATNLHTIQSLGGDFSKEPRLGGKLVSFDATYVDSGLADRLLNVAATAQGVGKDQLRAGLVGHLDEMVSGDLPEGVAAVVRQGQPAFRRFLEAPGRITVSARPETSLQLATLPILFERGDLDALDLTITTEPPGLSAVAETDGLVKAAAGGGKPTLELGLRFLRGEGVPQNFVSAAEQLKPVAEGGDPVAAFHLATLMETGLVPEADDASAYRLALKAAFGKAPGAEALLTRIERKLDAEAVAVAQNEGFEEWRKSAGTAFSTREAAARGGDVTAMRDLAEDFLHGVGLPRNYTQAYAYAILAAAGGDRLGADIRDRLVDGRRKGLTSDTVVIDGQTLAQTIWSGGLDVALAKATAPTEKDAEEAAAPTSAPASDDAATDDAAEDDTPAAAANAAPDAAPDADAPPTAVENFDEDDGPAEGGIPDGDAAEDVDPSSGN